MITLSAKDDFLKRHTPEQLAEVSRAVQNSTVKTAMIYAMSSLADEIASANANAAAHALILYGAKKFRDKLLNIAEPEVAPKELPPVTLEDVPQRTATANTEKK
jgi:hypothetical protein